MENIVLSNELTKKQKCFCKEYIIDFNGTRSAIRSGYSSKTAMEQASRLLRNVKVQQEIKRLSSEVGERNDIEIDEIVKGLKAIAFSDITDYIIIEKDKIELKDLTKLSKEKLWAVDYIHQTKGGGFKIKMCNKITALELLAKYKGMFTEKYQVQNSGAITTILELINYANGKKEPS